MNVFKTGLAAFVLLILVFQADCEEQTLSLVTKNQMEVDSDGWLRATSGDPYLVYSTQNRRIGDVEALLIRIQAKHVLNRHLYIEMFWATNSHGFSEAKKGFYIQPFNVKAEEEIPVVLNLGTFLNVMGENPDDKIELVRIDFDPRIAGQDFGAKVEISLIDHGEYPEDARIMKIHPPYIGRHAIDRKIFIYTIKSLVADIWAKFWRDPIFLVLYLGSVLGIIVAIIYLIRKPQLFNKMSPSDNINRASTI